MPVFPRDIQAALRAAARAFPAVVLTGPRRAGKTFCLRNAFPGASYHLLEEPDVIGRLRADPRGWLDAVRTPAILDEVQNVPEVLPYVRARIDAAPSRKGRWLLTGSQDFSLMAGVSESMAGRAAVFQLLPLSAREIGRWDLLRGGFPEVWLRPRAAQAWFRSYVLTYLERDVRAVTAVRDLATFRRFLGILATRSGQMLNKTDLAAPLGVSVPTVTQWIGVLETTGILLVVPPWFENLGKRLVKTPKVYLADPGLLCFLLGIETRAELERSPSVGAVFETFVTAEIAKRQVNAGRRRQLFYFRDQQGLEVDLVVPEGPDVTFVEAKWTRTPRPESARSLAALLRAMGSSRARGVVVHPAARGAEAEAPLVPGVVARTVEGYFVGPGGG